MSNLMFAAFCCFSLWDFYIPALGGRVFDYLGLFLLFVHMVVRLGARDYAAATFRYSHLLFLLALAPASLAAVVDGHLLTVVAFMIGAVLVYVAFACCKVDRGVLQRQLAALIVINLVFFFAQYLAFEVAGVVLDFHSRFGVISPRVFNEVTGYFRAAGLFQEPNSFSINLFMLLSLRILSGAYRGDSVFLGSIAALFLSQSLWGFGALLVLVLLKVDFLRFTVSRALAAVLVLTVASWVVEVLRNSSQLLEVVLDPITVGRLVNLENDPSRQDRFGGTDSLQFDQLFLFGHGVNAEDFQSFMGANGLSFYVYSFGVLGLFVLLCWLWSQSRGDTVAKLVTVLFAMTSYPLYTYAIWWAWLAVMCLAPPHRKRAAFPTRIALVPP